MSAQESFVGESRSFRLMRLKQAKPIAIRDLEARETAEEMYFQAGESASELIHRYESAED